VLSQSEKTNSRITETSFSKPYAEIKRALATRLRQAYGAAGREWVRLRQMWNQGSRRAHASSDKQRMDANKGT
jgi:hypothetical protein